MNYLPGPIGTIYDIIMYSTGTPDVSLEEALSASNQITDELNKAQEKTDLALEYLKKDHPDIYEKLNQQKEEARGFFSTMVKPAYEYLIDLLGIPENNGMGFLPLIPLSAIVIGTVASTAAVIAAVAYFKEASHAVEKEEQILNDPTIPASIKQRVLLRTSDSVWEQISSLSTTVKATAIAIVVGVVGYQFLKTIRGFQK